MLIELCFPGRPLPHVSRFVWAWILIALAGGPALLSITGCGGMSCDRAGEDRSSLEMGQAPEWTFDGTSIVTSAEGAPLVNSVASESWAAVVDAETRRTAWLVIEDTEEARLREVEPGRRWKSSGFVMGPGADVSEVLRDNKIIQYEWEIEREDDNSLAVRYSAQVLQHVVLASYSKFSIRLPLHLVAGARATLDDTFGGLIFEGDRIGPVHPSYWEGPARTIAIEGQRASLGLEVEEGGVSWISFLDGRALPSPDTSLVIELYPTLAGPHQRLGTLALKGTSSVATFRLTIGAPRPSAVAAAPSPAEARRQAAPAQLPSAVAGELEGAGWEIEPFLAQGREPRASGSLFGNEAYFSELPIAGGVEGWRLGVAGRGRPLPAFVAIRGPVEDLRLKINGRGDCLDGQEVVEELGVLSMDAATRAETVWRYAAETTYPMPLHPTPDLGDFLSSYGYGFSSTLSAMALVRLWGHAGLPARRVYLHGQKGYAVAEVYYEGDWHAYDLADRTFYIDPGDGSVASAKELVSTPDLVAANSDAAGMGPGGVPAVETARLKYKGAGISYNIGGLSFERLMKTSLRRGEMLLRSYRPLGRWAPSPLRPYNYANALLAFTPDFENLDALEGFSSNANFRVEDGGLVPEDPSMPASLEYRAGSPHVIVGARLAIEGTPETLQRVSMMLSKDSGGTWLPLDFDPASGSADLTSQLVPGPQEAGAAYETLERNFSYDLHIELSPAPGEESSEIKSLYVLTWSQVNPALLPHLVIGDNEIETRCASWGSDASVTLGWVEGDVESVPEYGFVGEDFHLTGMLTNRGDLAPEELEVAAYALTQDEPIVVGSWKPNSPSGPGAEIPFDMRCAPIDPQAQYPGVPVSEYDLMLEVSDSESNGWGARSRLRLPLRSRPDLVILPSLVRLSPSNPKPGEEVQITAFVRNFCPSRELLYMQGTPSPSAEVALYEISGDSHVLLQKVTIPGIAPGSAALAVFSWTTPKSPGRQSLMILADPENAIRERDESNSTTIDVEVSR